MKTQSKKTKTPWPTKKVMEQIYDLNLWGKNGSGFYSGFGSHDSELVAPYVKIIIEFLTSFDALISVLDLGCGDFNIGNQLVKYTQNYIAVDIVADLIEFNQTKFQANNLEFQCLDISRDNLPKADCVLIRQVLQHVSNAEVQRILNKLVNFKYVILTEHIPKGDFIPNKDIISGQGIRLKKNSGLDILKPPFNFMVQQKKELLRFELENGKGVIVTWLFKLF
jgi:SAM-dependent methyltransferase